MNEESHRGLQAVNKMIIKANNDIRAFYDVKKFTEVVFIWGKMVIGEGLEVLKERMSALDPHTNDQYRFLGCEQAEEIDKDKVQERTVGEKGKKMKGLIEPELYDKNIVKAVNTRVIRLCGYVVNVC